MRTTRLILCGFFDRAEAFCHFMAEQLKVKPETAFQSNEHIDRARRLHSQTHRR